eukprot:gnl/TRDRNA2_/TRDRNA2_191940_c0_seq1.p1 gnl/TRDRNA2_/TRDRNA2_191940_c0~~gnl/TRDRNA2_/TRDRNA2_191940_c0_seq1.p1  ORF type:complete len:306 (+),score=36.53 gnl/TRDRNA2_/TRDRNA2_191940_c0_seq1:49-918(+)
MALQQAGAAITDWLLSATCIISALALYRHCPAKKPRWYSCFIWAYVSEGVSCFFGGFMWGMGTNITPSPLPVLHAANAAGMIAGMAGEALALILAYRTLVEGTPQLGSTALWALLTKVAFVATICYVPTGYLTGVGVSFLMLPCALMPVAFALLMVPCWRYSYGNQSSSLPSACWRKVFAGNCLNLTGAVILSALDGDCTGIFCFGEAIPLLPKPCPYVMAMPPGSSCPLPPWFNHGAIMHIFAMAACFVSVGGLTGLIDCGWKAPAGSDSSQKLKTSDGLQDNAIAGG